MPTPALIVSGFLGAGKTTLVQRLLDAARRDGVRLAIVSNEFGDTGIDRALLDAGEEGFVELDGGCVCCRLSDALSETLERLLTEVRPDRLVLECSGAALPGEILVQFWRPPLSELISEEVVAVVVDAPRAVAHAEQDETFWEQIDAADLLLLNKADLVSAAALDQVEFHLDEVTGGQPLIRTVRADVDPALLFPPDPEALRQRRRDPDATLTDHTHVAYGTRELLRDDVVTEADLLDELAALGALRVKGFVGPPAGVRVVQGVGARITLEAPVNPVPDALVGRIVVITRQEAASSPHR